MKKSLLVLAALAALSVAFVSCGGGDNGSTPTTPANPADEVKTGIIFGDAVYKFSDLTIADAYSTPNVVVVNADGTLSVTAGSWDTFTVTLPATLDLSNVKVAVTAKAEAGYTQGP